MSILLRCRGCGKKIQVSEKYLGRRAICPRCGAKIEVREESALAEPVPPALVPVLEAPGSEAPETGVAERKQEPIFHEEEVPLLKKGKKAEIHDLVDMTAMVDIVFFLLIFFLVTSFQEIDSAIEVPALKGRKSGGAAMADSSSRERVTIKVEIDRNDQIRIDGAEIRSVEELYTRLREASGGRGEDCVMQVTGSGEAAHGTLVSVLDNGQEVGIRSIQLSVREDGAGAKAVANR